MNIRYTKQLKSNDCGATVIANACKWAGKSFNYNKHYKYLTDKLGIDKTGATELNKFYKFIESHKVPFKTNIPVEYPSEEYLENVLDKNKAIMLFFNKDGRGHVFLIIGQLKNKYICVNYQGRKGKTVSKINKSVLDNFDYSLAIVIKKCS